MPKLRINKIDQEMVLTRSFSVPDFRAVPLSEDKKTRTLEGHPAVFDSMTNIGGWYNEIIERGAFDECDFDDVPFFVNHDLRKLPLARSRRNNGNSTMQISIDNTGMSMKAEVDVENNMEARQLVSSIERQDVTGMSFMFRVKQDKWENLDTDMPTRRIQKVSKTYEVSAVGFPAYTQTDINARDKDALDNARAALDNARSQELENSKAVQILRAKNKIKGGL